MACKCIPIPKEDIPQAWPVAGPLIESALGASHGEVEAEDIREELLSGIGQLFLVIDDEEGPIAAFTLELREFKRKKVCFIPYIAGKYLDKWRDMMLNLAEKVALAEGATAVYGTGRRGWARALISSGYSEYYVTIGKEL